MGRHWGSGRATVESCRTIDVKRWRPYMGPAVTRLVCSWMENDGNVTASIGADVDERCMRLDYVLSGATMHQDLLIDWTPCHYGGVRAWFLCPFCCRRCAKLHGGGDGFACRRCYRLAHTSTRETPLERAERRLRKLRRRLDADDQRPRGMHRRTYERLLAEVWQLEHRVNSQFIGHLASTRWGRAILCNAGL